MNAHRAAPDSPAALIDLATHVYGRIARVAPYATGAQRLHLCGELALVDQVLDKLERHAALAAQAVLKALPPPPPAGPAPKPRPALPSFRGGRGLRQVPSAKGKKGGQ